MKTFKNDINSLRFGNDMSRIVRGLAIILMVCNHSMPGKVIGFAAVLFSFLVGYGYAFAKNRGPKHSLSRIWHLLRDYWFVIFAVSLPSALLAYHHDIPLNDIFLSMFGMNPALSCFCWYVYFYIFAMLVMPLISRLIDRFSWIGATLLAGAFGLLYWWLIGIAPADRIWGWNIAQRISHYMPVVIFGYLVAKQNVVALIRFKKSPVVPFIATACMVVIYLLRGLPYSQIFDFFWAPAFAFAAAALLRDYQLKPLRIGLTEMGMKSMNIWFLHALFFTTATKALYLPLVSWIHWTPGYVLAILLFSYLMAIVVDGLMKALTWSFAKLRTLPSRFA